MPTVLQIDCSVKFMATGGIFCERFCINRRLTGVPVMRCFALLGLPAVLVGCTEAETTALIEDPSAYS